MASKSMNVAYLNLSLQFFDLKTDLHDKNTIIMLRGNIHLFSTAWSQRYAVHERYIKHACTQ